MEGTAGSSRTAIARSRRWLPASRLARWILALVLLLAALLADYSTGNEASSSLYYLTAIAFSTWFLGSEAGAVMVVLSSLGWFTAYVLVGKLYSKTSILMWNLGGEVVVYSAFSWGLGLLRERMQAERMLAERLTAANELLDREAQLVGRLQSDMLPGTPPQMTGYRWSIRYETSARAGGDYYEFVRLPDGRVGILIADASGHGAPAAVLMAMARSALFMARRSETPGGALGAMNRHLAEIIPPGWFVTAGYLILDPASGSFDYSLAGHEPPLVMREATGTLETLAACGGPILGPFAETPYPSASGRLEPGDALILYTDGIPEAVGPDGELLGEQAFRAALEEARQLGPEAMRDRVLGRVARHRAGAPAADDLTLVILRRDTRAPGAQDSNPFRAAPGIDHETSPLIRLNSP